MLSSKAVVRYRFASNFDVIRICSGEFKLKPSEEFFARYRSLFGRIALQVARQWGDSRPEEIDEIVQEICLRIVRKRKALAQAVGELQDNEACAWVAALAANCARDYCKSKFRWKRNPRLHAPVEGCAEAIGIQMTKGHPAERNILFHQIDRLLKTKFRDRAIFWLYYRCGFTANEIAAMPAVGLSLKSVERVIHNLTERVRCSLRPLQPVVTRSPCRH